MTSHTIDRAVQWLERMLVAPDGSQGIYERYRINLGRINPWVRPDCCIETARTFYALGRQNGQPDLMKKALALVDFVCSLQRRAGGFFDGSFPFYRFAPFSADEGDIGDGFGIPNLPEHTWPNDNGKITEYLLWFYRQTNEARFLEAGLRALDYLLRAQAHDGAFSLTAQGDNPNFKAADFVVWGAVALARGSVLTGEARHTLGAAKALSWLRDHQHPSGRMMTGWDTARFEPWRPPSSESAVGLHAFAQGLSVFGESWMHGSLGKLGDTLLRWQHSSGAIRNCDSEARAAALQNDPDMTDLVYSNGYALIALQEAFAVTHDERFVQAARRLADFLVRVQCSGESPHWDGAWRGSYHLEKQIWHGAADFDNDLEEGGMNAVYTGWCAAPNAYGLFCLQSPDCQAVLG